MQRPHHPVVHTALGDDADVARPWRQHFIETVFANEAHRGRPALVDLLLLVQIAGRWQHDALGVALGLVNRVLQAVAWPPIGPRLELSVHMASADAQLEHDRRVAGLGQLKALFDHTHDGG